MSAVEIKQAAQDTRTLLDRCSDYTLAQIVTPEGENVLGEEYYEFYVDEEKLEELVLQLFNAPK